MDRLLLIDKNGKLFEIEPPENSMINEITADDSDVKLINRVSNCGWCCWGITNDFEIFLYVYKSSIPIQRVEITCEKNRKNEIDYCNSVYDSVYSADEIHLLPSENWSWNSEWHILYYDEKKSTNKFKNKWDTVFKKKRLSRTRKFISYNKFIMINPPNDVIFITDITVGGWLMKNNINNQLSVWMVSNTGKLYFRTGVSFSNPEGSTWLKIDLPDDLECESFSCSQDGNLWIITCQGFVLERIGISIENSIGKYWRLLLPFQNARFTQISCNINLVYALDIKGSVYLLSKEKSEWIKVLNDLSYISLSMSNKLWSLSKNRNKIFIGSNVHSFDNDSFNPSTFSWICIDLPQEFDRIDAAFSCDFFEDLTKLTVKSAKS